MYQQLKEEMLRMFYDDENLVKQRVSTLSERAKAALRTTRLPPPIVLPGQSPTAIEKPVIEADSLLQKGLLANKDFEIGEFITSFPVDATTYKDDDDGLGKVCYAAEVDMAATEESEVLEANFDFVHIVSPKGIPVSMALPSVTEASPAYMGHWATDGAALTGDTPEEVRTYKAASFKAANAAHVLVCDGIFVWTVATKPIKKGEEIFVTMGVPWWKNWLSRRPHVQTE